jgi:hypothetical protein
MSRNGTYSYIYMIHIYIYEYIWNLFIYIYIIHIFVIKGVEAVHCCEQLVSKLPNQHFSFENACNIGKVVLLL